MVTIASLGLSGHVACIPGVNCALPLKKPRISAEVPCTVCYAVSMQYVSDLHGCVLLTMQGWQGNTPQGHTLPTHDVACSAEAATAATAVLAAAAATLEAEQRSAATAQNTASAAVAKDTTASAEATPDSKVGVKLDNMNTIRHVSSKARVANIAAPVSVARWCVNSAQEFHTPAQSLHQSTSEHSMASAVDTLDGNSGPGIAGATPGTTAEHPVRGMLQIAST